MKINKLHREINEYYNKKDIELKIKNSKKNTI